MRGKAVAVMEYAEFKKAVNISKKTICQEILAQNRDRIRIKKHKTVLKNLEKIFTATLKISNKKGFQAMSMRDLSRETGLSSGALYSYFSGKEELLEMMQAQQRAIVQRILEQWIPTTGDARIRLEAAVKTHLFLSERMQPWFYFTYMEAKHLPRAQREKAIASSRYTKELIADILKSGQAAGQFGGFDPGLGADLIKALLQDWYLKRSEYRRQEVAVDGYADFVWSFVMAAIQKS